MKEEFDVSRSNRVGYSDISVQGLANFWRNNKDFVRLEIQLKHLIHSIRYLC